MRNAWVLFITLLVSVGLRAENSCGALVAKDSEGLRTFLQEEVGLRQSPCLTSAIKQLGERQDVAAVRLLISYLDYLDPSTAPLPGGGMTVRPDYPAVSALFQIGKPATVDLLSAIQEVKSPRAVENAIQAYEYIYRDDLASGIRGLQTAELLAKTDNQRRRLLEARQKLIEACNSGDEEEAQKCKNTTTQ
jgi:HEAT repeat protein